MVKDKRLVVEPEEAERVRLIFRRYLDLKCLGSLAVDLAERGIILTKVTDRRDDTVRGDIAFTRGPLCYLLRNRVCIGEIVHKGRH